MAVAKGESFSLLMPIANFLVVSLITSWCSSWYPLAVALSTIRHLPGFQGPLPFDLETGYVTVDELNGGNLFYYFIKSERNPAEDPVMVWLTGGPGCSSFSGLAFEIGPLSFDVAGYKEGLPSLIYNPHSWTKVSNIIFLDSPIGAGFSYSKNSNGYETGDTKSSKQIHMFIRKWFTDHPEFLSNPLYIGGDSYSGITVPLVAQEISNETQGGDKPLFNLKGYLLGNPVADKKFDSSYLVPYLHGMGLISNELYESTKISCGGVYTNPSNAQCAEHLESVGQCILGVNYAHILEPACFFASPKPDQVVAYRRSLDEHAAELYLSKSLLPLECRSSGYLLSYLWINNDVVREALGIHKGTVKQWRRCIYGLSYTMDVHSSLIYHLNLTTKGYRALVYSGDHDIAMPFLGTQAWIRSLNFSIVDDWRSWHVDGQVAGFTRAYSNNLTFATVKGGGHTAPEYRPKECFAMFQRWSSGNSL